MHLCDLIIEKNTDYMIGEARLLAELDIYSIKNEKISYNWFRKLCRRCNLPSIQTRTDLFNMGYIEKRNMPCKLLKRASEFKTYDEWKKCGYCVQQGQTSYARNLEMVAVFSNNQVYKVK